MSKEVATEELFTWIRSGIAGRNRAIEYLYRQSELRAKIIQFVMNKGGSRDQGEDTYVDAIVAFVKNAKAADFRLQQNVEGYLFGASRYIWFGKLRKTSNTVPLENNAISNTSIAEPMENPLSTLLAADKKKWIDLFLKEIDSGCRKVLKMWAYSYRMKEIKTAMQYSTDEVARKKKHLCLKKLYHLIEDRKEWTSRLREL